MKAICCLKEVPGRDTRFEITADENWVEETDLSWEISECDEYALEESLKLVEKHGGEVIAVTVGSERAEKSMRKALAMGAARGILGVDSKNRSNSPHSIAATLTELLSQEHYDLILVGTQSDDLGYAQTGPMVAQMLGLTHATIVMEVEATPDSGKVRVLREMESGWFQRLEMSLPAVLTIQAGICKVRYPSLKGIMQAKRKEIRKVSVEDLGIEWETIPRLEVSRLSLPESSSKVEMLNGDAEAAVEQLVERLRKEAKVL